MNAATVWICAFVGVLLLSSCGLETTISLCPLDDANIQQDGPRLSFTHRLCADDTPSLVQVEAFRGYDIYYRIYGDTSADDTQQEQRDDDIDAILDPEREAALSLDSRDYRRIEARRADDRDQRTGRPTIDLSASDAARQGPVGVVIDFSGVLADEEPFVEWGESENGNGDRRILRRNIDVDNNRFTSDEDDYSANDADVDNQVAEDETVFEIVLFAVSFGRDAGRPISSFEARLLTDDEGLELVF